MENESQGRHRLAKVHLHGKWPLKVCVSSATGSQCSICRGGVGFNPTGWVEGYFLTGVQNFLVWNGSCLYVFPEQQNTPKTFDGRSFARDPTGAAYSDPSDPLAGQKGLTLTFCSQSCGLQITIPVFFWKRNSSGSLCANPVPVCCTSIPSWDRNLYNQICQKSTAVCMSMSARPCWPATQSECCTVAVRCRHVLLQLHLRHTDHNG